LAKRLMAAFAGSVDGGADGEIFQDQLLPVGVGERDRRDGRRIIRRVVKSGRLGRRDAGRSRTLRRGAGQKADHHRHQQGGRREERA